MGRQIMDNNQISQLNNLLPPKVLQKWLASKGLAQNQLTNDRDKLGIIPQPLSDEQKSGQGLIKSGLESLPQLGSVAGGALGMGLGGAGAIPAASMGAAVGEGLKQLGENYLLDKSPDMSMQERIHAIAGQGLAGGMTELPGQGFGMLGSAIGQVEKPAWMKVIQGEGKATPKVEADDIGMYPIRETNSSVPIEQASREQPFDLFQAQKTEKQFQDPMKQAFENEMQKRKEPASVTRIGLANPVSQAERPDVFKEFEARFPDKAKEINELSNQAAKENKAYIFDPNKMPVPVPNPNLNTNILGEARINDAAFDDPLRWADSKYGVTKAWMEKNADKPITINTSSDLIARDDYAALINPKSKVNLYDTTDNEHINRMIFPGNASSARINKAYEKLKDAGVNVELIKPTKQDIIDTLAARGKDVSYVKKATGTSLDQLIADGTIKLRTDLKSVKESPFKLPPKK